MIFFFSLPAVFNAVFVCNACFSFLPIRANVYSHHDSAEQREKSYNVLRLMLGAVISSQTSNWQQQQQQLNIYADLIGSRKNTFVRLDHQFGHCCN